MAIKRLKTKSIREFGDFQTPPSLARLAMQSLAQTGLQPRSIVEPTCGRGGFVHAVATHFPDAETIVGIEINPKYLDEAKVALVSDRRVELKQGDFFKVDWGVVVTPARAPWLIVGNPPWVTSAELGSIASENIPQKSNFQGRRGLDALTGKSNFDISEWMILRYLDWLSGQTGTIAVLCKTGVARKILLHIWQKKMPLAAARICKIDASKEFGAAVEACFFVLEIRPNTHAISCEIYDAIDAVKPSSSIGFRDGHIVNNIAAFNRHRSLLGPEDHYVWRSGVKHDCSKVMELMQTPNGFENGFGEVVDLETTFAYPMLKSSDIGNERFNCRGVMIVTQKFVGETTGQIKAAAPKTWAYLESHAELLNKRGSIIYKNKPPYSVFGVGPYTYAPWKIAISGFYKKLRFLKIGPVGMRPVVFDDTINFLPCGSEDEADFIKDLLGSAAAQEFLQSMIYWDEKRPITVDILKRLSIRKLASSLGQEPEYEQFIKPVELSIQASRR